MAKHRRVTPDTLGAVIGRRIRQLRERQEITQHQLADRAGISRATVAKLELGLIASPKSGVLAAMAKVLGVGTDELFDGAFPRTMALQPLVERFLSGPWGEAMAVTPTEAQWLRSFPSIDWAGDAPTEQTIAKLVEALRATRKEP